MENIQRNHCRKISVIIPKRKGEDISKYISAIEHSVEFRGISAPKNPIQIEIVVVNRGEERSNQRNTGIDQATGDYLLILDSDQMVSDTLISECTKIMDSDPECTGIYIPERIILKSWFDVLRDFERQFYNGTPVDVVRFVRKSNCPDFDPTMSGPEDSDWGNRIPGKKRISQSCFYHYDNIGILAYFKKKAYYSESMRRYAEKWPDDKVLKFWYRCFWIFCENGKWKRLLRHPVASLMMFGLIFMRGIVYLWNR